LGAVLGLHAEQEHVAGAHRVIDQRRFAGEHVLAEQPAGGEDARLRIARDDLRAGAAGELRPLSFTFSSDPGEQRAWLACRTIGASSSCGPAKLSSGKAKENRINYVAVHS
jgi:hypothetical protein